MFLEPWLNLACREEAQPYVQGFPGAKFKKFKTQPEAEQWYRSNLPQRSVHPKTTTATPATPAVSSPRVTFTSSSSTSATYTPSNPPTASIPRPLPRSISKAVTTPTPAPVNPPRIAAPKNTTVDIVYSDGACQGNGGVRATAGIGVWWGPDDPRYNDSPSFHASTKLIEFTHRNLSERCPGPQTNNRAELIVRLQPH